MEVLPFPIKKGDPMATVYGSVDAILNASGLSCAECIGVLEYLKAKMVKQMIEKEDR